MLASRSFVGLARGASARNTFQVCSPRICLTWRGALIASFASPGLPLLCLSSSADGRICRSKGPRRKLMTLHFLLAANWDIICVQGKYTVTLIPGDGSCSAHSTFYSNFSSYLRAGIGPEISESVKGIYSAANVRNLLRKC